jgi:hypothetical protein
MVRGATQGHPAQAPLPPLDALRALEDALRALEDALRALEDERRLPPVVIPVLIGASAARTTRW